MDQPLESLEACDLWQLKLVLSYYSHHFSMKTLGDKTGVTARRRLVHAEACAHFKSRLDSALDGWLQSESIPLLNYCIRHYFRDFGQGAVIREGLIFAIFLMFPLL